jgi:non-ribosomal peptide synthetase component E (peptide arylation enzyme)
MSFVNRYQDKLAIVFKDKRLTYRQCRDSISVLVFILIGLGVRKGDGAATATWNSMRDVLIVFCFCSHWGKFHAAECSGV